MQNTRQIWVKLSNNMVVSPFNMVGPHLGFIHPKSFIFIHISFVRSALRPFHPLFYLNLLV
jgi:hypothetical protein